MVQVRVSPIQSLEPPSTRQRVAPKVVLRLLIRGHSDSRIVESGDVIVERPVSEGSVPIM